jgi:hypothetical protein
MVTSSQFIMCVSRHIATTVPRYISKASQIQEIPSFKK